MAKTLYRVELQICTGHSTPIPVLPEMPHYRFAVLGPDEPKRKAWLRAKHLLELNPGYTFVVSRVVKAEKGGGK